MENCHHVKVSDAFIHMVLLLCYLYLVKKGWLLAYYTVFWEVHDRNIDGSLMRQWLSFTSVDECNPKVDKAAEVKYSAICLALSLPVPRLC